MSRKKKVYDDDDGRTISNMNVEGMPWYVPPRPDGGSGVKDGELSKEETRAFMKGALTAALLVAAIFAVAFFVFIFLLDKYLP